MPVAAVPDGATTAPLPTPGTASYPSIDRIAFRHFGSGPDLLLITGEDASMASWPAPFLAALAQHYRVTIFDLPGTGYSGPLPASTQSRAVGGRHRRPHRGPRPDAPHGARVGPRRGGRSRPGGAAPGERRLARARRHLGRGPGCDAPEPGGRTGPELSARHGDGAGEGVLLVAFRSSRGSVAAGPGDGPAGRSDSAGGRGRGAAAAGRVEERRALGRPAGRSICPCSS